MPDDRDDRLEPEFADAFEAHRGGPTPQTAGHLLRTVNPVIDLAVRTYGGANAGPSLRGHARRIALHAFDSYDPARGALKSHLMGHLQGLRRVAARGVAGLSVPERVALDRAKLEEASAELEDRLGRGASLGELSDHLGMSAKRIAHVRGYATGIPEGQVAGFGDGEGGPYEPAVAGGDAYARRAEFLHPDLDGPDQAILEHAYGLFGAPRLRPGIVAKKLGLSAGAVSQRARHLQARLDELGDLGMF